MMATLASMSKKKVKYAESLDSVTSSRYHDKLRLINGEDPYETPKKEWNFDPNSLPAIAYPDIVNYCVYSQSAYTLNDLKGYKSLEAYNQFICGWVSDVCAREVNGHVVVTARVRHSQSISKTPLQPWIIAEKDGNVLSAHCTCMAGLGEVCTHVGAVLFFVSSAVEIRSSQTVTQEKAYWLLPSGMKGVDCEPVQDINFKSAKALKKNIDCAISHTLPNKHTKSMTLPDVPPPTDEELSTLFRSLHVSGTKPVILSFMSDYADDYVPRQLSSKYPLLLSELRDEQAFHLSKDELFKKCEEVFQSISVTNDQVQLVEEKTRQQADCKEWHRFRTGRITASRMKAVCRTSEEKPARSLIKAICYPDTVRFRTKATQWGCQHEEDGLAAYRSRMERSHDAFKIEKCGFIISSEYPHIGASPDSMVECSCCGKGTVEVKCPYCVREKDIPEFLEKVSCLETIAGKIQLRKCHQYFYQVQTQLFVCNVEYCDFVIWTEKGLHHDRIEPDHALCVEICEKATGFFKRAVLPELVGKYFSKIQSAAEQEPSTHANEEPSTHANEELFCVCQTVHDEKGKYVGCDNADCRLKWCHFQCMGIKRAPKGKWYCPECQELPEFSSKKRKINSQ